jgi:sugar-specific transcriptional regulator TrmB
MEPKTTSDFQSKSDEIRKKRKRLERSLAKAKANLDLLQSDCKHVNSTYENCGRTSNAYNATDDIYWRWWKCYDCGKIWQTSQTETPIASAIKLNDRTKEEVKLLLKIRGIF